MIILKMPTLVFVIALGAFRHTSQYWDKQSCIIQLITDILIQSENVFQSSFFFLHVNDDAFNSFMLQQQHYVVMIGRWHCNQEFTLYIGIAFTWKPNTVYNTWFMLWRIQVFWDLKLCHWVSVPSWAFQETWTSLTTATRTSHLMLSILSGNYCLMHHAARWQSVKWSIG